MICCWNSVDINVVAQQGHFRLLLRMSFGWRWAFFMLIRILPTLMKQHQHVVVQLGLPLATTEPEFLAESNLLVYFLSELC